MTRGSKAPAREDRAKRLADALRANLRRRKGQPGQKAANEDATREPEARKSQDR